MDSATPSRTFIRAGQAARLLGVSTERLRQLADAGRIPSERTLYGQRVYDIADVARLSNERQRQHLNNNNDNERNTT